MIKKRYLVALGAFSAGLAACSADIKPQPGGSGATGGSSTPSTGGTSGKGSGGSSAGTSQSGGSSGNSGTSNSGGSGGGSGGSGGGSGGTGAGSSGGGQTSYTCAPGVPATTQIPRMLNRQYDNVVRDLLGVTTLASAQGKKPSDLLFADFDGPMVSDAWRLYQDTAATIAKEVMGGANKTKFISCDPAATNCLSDSIKAFGRKAFRRPMTDAEVSNFVTKLSSTNPMGQPAEIAEAALVAFLVAPSFILIPELTPGTADAAGEVPLSSYEVAARLSFLLWGSVPDDTLNQAADANQLQTKDQILTQAKRMVMDRTKTGPMISTFHRVAWAHDDNTATSHWWKMDHDGNTLYNSSLKATYQGEIDKFFEEVAYTGGSFKDLFLSPIAFVTKDTAPIYGLDPSAYTTDYTKVSLDPAQRPGFMTRMGFLSSYAHPSETSPILRGAFIEVNMVSNNPGPPLAGATMTPIPPGNYTTNRQKTDALVHTSTACQGCHVPIIDPAGFALENYDSIGKWQTVDPLGGTIDATGDVMLGADDTVHITSPQQLMQEIAATPSAKQIYAQQWVSYTTGRLPNNNDQCLVDAINMNLAQDGYTVLNLLADLTQADSFRLRVQATP